MSMAIIVGGAVQVDSDLRTRCVARFPTYLMGLVGVVSALFAGRLLSSLMIAALAVGCTFWIIHRWRTDALGFGDVLLAPVIALYVGWFKVSNIPLWLLMASSGAALTALMSHRRLVAFVPWLVGIAVATILLTTPATYSG